jgi:hypothetical protein
MELIMKNCCLSTNNFTIFYNSFQLHFLNNYHTNNLVNINIDFYFNKNQSIYFNIQKSSLLKLCNNKNGRYLMKYESV